MPARPSPIERLSPRQREILELVSRGLTNDDIARVLSISPLTVRTHMTALLAALEVGNRTEAAAAYVAWEAHPHQIAAVLQRPAIAVLPFAALGGGERAKVLAAGMTADLGALFSRWCWFPVIAQSSAAAIATTGTAVERGRQLGARFLVEGTLQVQRSELRLSVRIDDAETGHSLWTQAHRFRARAVFEIQDEVCEAIVAAAYPVLIERTAVAPPAARHPASVGAWELAHEGMRLHAMRAPAANVHAAERFEGAIRSDPGLVLAHFGSGLAAYDALLNQWGPKPAAHARLEEAAERCLALAPHAAEGFYLLARKAQALGDHQSAVHPLTTAIARNPRFAHAHALLAQVLELSGRSDEALARMQHAVRLGPSSFVAGLAALHFSRREYGLALEAAERAVATNPRYTFARALACAAGWWHGERARAREHLRVLRADHPSFAAESFLSTFGRKGAAPVERIVKALATAELQ